MAVEAGTPSADSGGLDDFGYKESLDRSIGKFASFAAGVSYISILTGTFQLFYFGFSTAGPAYLWSWPIVFVGQMAVALCFMELAAKYPVAGSVYNWSKKLGSRIVGWMSGWLMLTASIVTISAVVLAYQLNLPRLWSGFQIIGDGSTPAQFAGNAVILGIHSDRLHDAHQRARREADGDDQQCRCLHRTHRGRADRDHPGVQHDQGAVGLLPDQRLRGRAAWRISRRVPDRLARIGLRDVRLRHRQLAR